MNPMKGFEVVLTLIRQTMMPLDREVYGVLEHVKYAAALTPAGSTLLDAGSGMSPYKPLFPHVNYISMDFAQVNKEYRNLNIIADLCAIPLTDSVVDMILCVEVLEHVREPELVLREFYRILGPGGKLFLTTRQAWPLHEEPFDYYRFTSYGLNHLLTKAGFQVGFIAPMGGYFWNLGYHLGRIGHYAYHRHRILGFPLLIAFRILIPWLCFYLDRFDRAKKHTLGYRCYAQKQGGPVMS